MGLTIAESQATLDARFPTAAATDYIARDHCRDIHRDPCHDTSAHNHHGHDNSARDHHDQRPRRHDEQRLTY
jgi:hypothetical protein